MNLFHVLFRQCTLLYQATISYRFQVQRLLLLLQFSFIPHEGCPKTFKKSQVRNSNDWQKKYHMILPCQSYSFVDLPSVCFWFPFTFQHSAKIGQALLIQNTGRHMHSSAKLLWSVSDLIHKALLWFMKVVSSSPQPTEIRSTPQQEHGFWSRHKLSIEHQSLPVAEKPTSTVPFFHATLVRACNWRGHSTLYWLFNQLIRSCCWDKITVAKNNGLKPLSKHQENSDKVPIPKICARMKQQQEMSPVPSPCGWFSTRNSQAHPLCANFCQCQPLDMLWG